MSRRISFLLGAGASKEAGLPMTHELSKELIDSLNDERYNRHARNEPWLQALNFAYGQIVGHQAQDGGNPNQAVGIERLISALRLLAAKDEHEAAPFVAGWKPGADGFDEPPIPEGLGDAVLRATGNDDDFYGGSPSARTGDASAVDSALRSILLAREEGRSDTSFSRAEERLVRALRKRLSEVGPTEYLRPLVNLAAQQDEGLDVLSLNYDPVIEELAQEAGLTVDKGLPKWKPGESMQFSQAEGTVRLYKVHGSTDWFARHGGVEAIPSIYRQEASPEPPEGYDPWIVVGDREKLSTPGPILELLRAAEDALSTTEHLIIIGYSFSDAHINALVTNWMHGSDTRTLSVIDPGWPPYPGGYRAHLIEAYGLRVGPAEVERPSRLFIRKGTTSEMLQRAIDDANFEQEVERIDITPESGDGPGVIRFRNVGCDEIYDLTLEVGAPAQSEGIDPDNRLELDIQAGPGTYGISNHPFELSYDSLPVGKTFDVAYKGSIDEETVARITYRRFDSWTKDSVTVNLDALLTTSREK